MIGRPLLDDGRAHVAPTREGGAWPRQGTSPAPAIAEDLRAALAQGWLDDALLEHASVASFARATLELMALGAPPELLTEELRAEVCANLIVMWSTRSSRRWFDAIEKGDASEILIALAEYHLDGPLLEQARANFANKLWN